MNFVFQTTEAMDDALVVASYTLLASLSGVLSRNYEVENTITMADTLSFGLTDYLFLL